MPPKATSKTSTASKSTASKSSSAAAAPKPGVRRMAAAKPKPAAKGGAAAKPAAAKAEPKPAPPKREFMDIELKQIKPVLMVEPDNAIMKSGKAALLVDPSTRALTLLRYGDEVIMIDAFNPSPLEAEKLRKSLLFALRWGRTIVFNMEENDLTGTINDACEKLQPGLWAKMQDRSITKVENIKPFLRQDDAQEFASEMQYMDDDLAKFRVVVFTSNDNPSDSLKDNFFCVHVQ